ncbi:MAG: addiction module protein [Gammaproteobacteria bacterium]|nr:addiction module protein [Gammaproteobacteria bacterium]
MAASKEIFKKALSLKPLEKAELVDELLSSLDQSDQAITELWAKEAESRLDAYEKRKLKAVSLEKVLSKYK